MTNSMSKIIMENIIIVIVAAISALGFHIFVFPVNFTPMGVDGISTMLQAVTDVNAGIYSMLINAPFLIAGWFFINRKYVIYTIIFTIFNTVFLLVLSYVDFSALDMRDNDLLAALFAGAILGFRAGVMIRIGGSTGGLDVIAALLHKKLTHINFEKLFFVLNIITVGMSFFVYGYQMQPILLAIIYSFVYTRIMSGVLQGPKSALEFRIITNSPAKLVEQIIKEIKHGVTVVEAKGGFTDNEKKMLFCAVNKREVVRFQKIIRQHPETFAYYSEINDVVGNFRRGRNEIPK